MSLGDSPSDLDSEAFERTSTIISVGFHTFKVSLNRAKPETGIKELSLAPQQDA